MDAATKENLFANEDENLSSRFAWAFLVFSMMPYLGILFSIPAIVISLATLSRSRRALWFVSAAFIILAIQIILWWLLYIIPTLGGVSES